MLDTGDDLGALLGSKFIHVILSTDHWDCIFALLGDKGKGRVRLDQGVTRGLTMRMSGFYICLWAADFLKKPCTAVSFFNA